MARLPKNQREERDKNILSDWKAGYSQNYIAKQHEVSPATVNKICKGVPQENKELVNTQSAINAELTTKSEQELNSIHKAVDKRTKHLLYFQNAALKNQEKANTLMDEADSISDIESHSRITARNKETVLGKDASTQIAIQNNNTQVTLTLDDFYED
jgi:hypothetical protein